MGQFETIGFFSSSVLRVVAKCSCGFAQSFTQWCDFSHSKFKVHLPWRFWQQTLQKKNKKKKPHKSRVQVGRSLRENSRHAIFFFKKKKKFDLFVFHHSRCQEFKAKPKNVYRSKTRFLTRPTFFETFPFLGREWDNASVNASMCYFFAVESCRKRETGCLLSFLYQTAPNFCFFGNFKISNFAFCAILKFPRI